MFFDTNTCFIVYTCYYLQDMRQLQHSRGHHCHYPPLSHQYHQHHHGSNTSRTGAVHFIFFCSFIFLIIFIDFIWMMMLPYPLSGLFFTSIRSSTRSCPYVILFYFIYSYFDCPFSLRTTHIYCFYKELNSVIKNIMIIIYVL